MLPYLDSLGCKWQKPTEPRQYRVRGQGTLKEAKGKLIKKHSF